MAAFQPFVVGVFMLGKVRKRIAEAIAKAANIDVETALSSLESPKERFGDVASNVSFQLAKKMKRNPTEIAEELAKKVKRPALVEKVEAKGPYLNFYLSSDFYYSALQEILKKGEIYGRGRKKEKVIVEFPSVNPNKPWHAGHLRNALLGDVMARLLAFSGYRVERIDYINDLGLQVAQSLWHFLNTPAVAIDKKFDHWLGEKYIKIAQEFEKKQEVQRAVRNLLKQLESGKNEVAEKGRWLAEECLKAQYETAFRFGIFHNAVIFESDLMRTLFAGGIELLKKGRAITLEKEGKNAGCWVVKLPKSFEQEFGEMREADKILIRSDGTITYTGKDVIFHLWKFGKLKKQFVYNEFIKQPNGETAYRSAGKGIAMAFGRADIVINVIGMEQRYPQRVISEVLRLIGYEKEAASLFHLAYEHVTLPEMAFSGRAGTWMGYTADELAAEAEKRALEKVKDEIPLQEKKEIARIIGLGAIKFSFLKTSADKRILFLWDKALSLEGDSGPYLQYAYVRTKGILKKASFKPAVRRGYSFTTDEQRLLKRLCEFPDIVERAAAARVPHILCDYLLDVAADLNKFYTTSRVLDAEKEEERQIRLAIVHATNIILRNALWLLGIDCPERM